MSHFFYRQRLLAAVCALFVGRGWPLFFAALAPAEALRPCGDLVAWSSLALVLIFVAEGG